MIDLRGFGSESGNFDKALRKSGLLPSCPLVLVAGSSGKSMTIAYLDAILRALGKKVGAYYNCFDDNEDDIRVDGQRGRIDTSLLSLAKKYDLSAEQAKFLLALSAYKDCDYLLIEQPLGGVSSPIYSELLEPSLTILTSVGLDHVEELGTTESSIALDCAALAVRDSVLLSFDLNELNEPPVKEYCEDNKVKWVKANAPFRPHYVGDRLVFDIHNYPNLAIFTPVAIEMLDVALAVEAAKELGLSVDGASLQLGLDNVSLPNHHEKRGLYLFDCASSPEMIAALAKSYPSLALGEPLSVVFAAKKGSNVAAILPLLDNAFDKVYLTGVPGDEGFWNEDDFFLFTADHPFIEDLSSIEGKVLILGDKRFLAYAKERLK